MKASTYLLLVLGVLFTSIIACRKKEEDKKSNPDISVAQDVGEGKSANDADINILNDQAQTLGGAKKTSTLEFPVGTNITRTITTSNDSEDTTWTTTIDFGNSDNGLYCAFDGLYRKGKIIYTLTEIDSTLSMVGEANFEDYYIGKNKANIKREGKIKETYSINGSLQFQYTYQTLGGKLTRPEGKSATWTDDCVGIWKTTSTSSGYYEVTGNGNGTTYNGNAYDYAIDKNNPLVYESNCIYPTKGIMVLTDKTNNKTYTFDYNTGNCNTVNITVDGQTQTVNLGLR